MDFVPKCHFCCFVRFKRRAFTAFRNENIVTKQEVYTVSPTLSFIGYIHGTFLKLISVSAIVAFVPLSERPVETLR